MDVLDQTLLPFRKKSIACRNGPQVAAAIKDMKLRGAPLIGIAAAFALAMDARRSRAVRSSDFIEEMRRSGDSLVKTRPTAVNLKWAVDRMLGTLDPGASVADLKTRFVVEAEKIYAEDLKNNRLIGRNGAKLIKNGANVLTHCNAGALATAGLGTALAVLRAAHAEGKKIQVYVDETRPYLQGARLTAFEMAEEGIPHVLITDSMAGHFMSKGDIDAVIVGADRIAANGDTANKIGTYSLAVLARAHGIPFYVAAPASTIDLRLPSGAGIPIEMRSGDEVKFIFGKAIAPKETKALHPAFDVTPANFITALITEKGVIRPPFGPRLRKSFL